MALTAEQQGLARLGQALVFIDARHREMHGRYRPRLAAQDAAAPLATDQQYAGWIVEPKYEVVDSPHYAPPTADQVGTERAYTGSPSGVRRAVAWRAWVYEPHICGGHRVEVEPGSYECTGCSVRFEAWEEGPVDYD